MKFLCFLACLFACIGAINWGLVAFLQFNLVEYINTMAGVSGLDLVIYGIVALSGIYGLIMALVQLCKFHSCNCQPK